MGALLAKKVGVKSAIFRKSAQGALSEMPGIVSLVKGRFWEWEDMASCEYLIKYNKITNCRGRVPWPQAIFYICVPHGPLVGVYSN